MPYLQTQYIMSRSRGPMWFVSYVHYRNWLQIRRVFLLHDSEPSDIAKSHTESHTGEQILGFAVPFWPASSFVLLHLLQPGVGNKRSHGVCGVKSTQQIHSGMLASLVETLLSSIYRFITSGISTVQSGPAGKHPCQ